MPAATQFIACPFCPLHCDDLTLRARVPYTTCPRGRDGFTAALAVPEDAPPRIRGKSVGLDEALDEAGRILGSASRPLIAGMAGDVAAVRAAMDLAERLGAVVDHLHGDALARSLSVLQGSGWSTSCLHEARNRADLVVLVGGDLEERYPRLLERLLDAGPGLFTETHRIIVIDSVPSARADAMHLPCPLGDLGAMAATLRALLAERPVKESPVDGLSLDALRDFLDAVIDARYSVFITTASLMESPHADLALEALAGFIQAVNGHTRCTLLNLPGGAGDTGAWQVGAWKTGFPLRVDFAAGAPVYDPHLNGTERLIRDGCDAMLWLSSLEPRTPPRADGVARVVVSRADVELAGDEAVFIPVGVPGVDHAGHLFRGDGAGLIAMGALRTVERPAAADVLRGLLARLRTGVRPC